MRLLVGEEVAKITEGIIGAVMEVSRVPGHGFLETVYRKALVHELNVWGFPVEAERPFKLKYKDVSVGTYYCDILVNQKVVVELKAVDQLTSSHVGQVLN